MSDFEKTLSRIPLHPAPAEWRADILRAARAAVPESAPAPWWQLWLTPQRLALASAWLLIAIFRMAALEISAPSPASVAQLEARVSMQLALIAELLDPPAPPPQSRPPHGAVLSRRPGRFA